MLFYVFEHVLLDDSVGLLDTQAARPGERDLGVEKGHGGCDIPVADDAVEFSDIRPSSRRQPPGEIPTRHSQGMPFDRSRRVSSATLDPPTLLVACAPRDVELVTCSSTHTHDALDVSGTPTLADPAPRQAQYSPNSTVHSGGEGRAPRAALRAALFSARPADSEVPAGHGRRRHGNTPRSRPPPRLLPHLPV
ncbi:hypothetical protein BD626DRAFT_574902 [Schizophyllum amplum]|uniref:Uncharacterized protein n=1 Tax=Schizophyllum amplum TaxID=97359 RepID=A0A550BX12_9AGAR|nr:hypothetical protein BD626DRAFT_574902 [Auriculariopsis ampla]